MGCQVALAAAYRHPERAGGLILIGPTLGDGVVPAWRYVGGLLADIFFERMLYNCLLVKMYCEMGIPRYCATTLKMFSDRPLSHAREIESDVLVVRGQYDLIVPDTAARRLAAALGHSRFERVPGSAHAVQFNCPRLIARMTTTFLEQIEDRA
jgi:pimeloyl-ACP methyl ester carboxylesterase